MFKQSRRQERARVILASMENIVLNCEDWQRLFEALNRADRPRPNLAAAVRQYEERHGKRESGGHDCNPTTA